MNSRFVRGSPVISGAASHQTISALETPKAGNRIALIIGNSRYQHVASLKNPKNDASDLASAFKKIGFDDVTSLQDLPRAAFLDALALFATKARSSTMSVVYFSGHGIELNSANYLIPIDATLESVDDVATQTVSLSSTLGSVGFISGPEGCRIGCLSVESVSSAFGTE